MEKRDGVVGEMEGEAFVTDRTKRFIFVSRI